MDVIVVGGGPAGMMAAGRAAELGAKVLIIEKNLGLGQKLLISGGGRCNFTNAESDVRQLTTRYGLANKALLSPFSKFSADACLDFFAKRGMNWKIEDNLRAFPASNSAASVLAVLAQYLKQGQVQIRLADPVKVISRSANGTINLQTERTNYRPRRLIMACGGTSHPETGSTGDGFRWLRSIGHTVRDPEPSLVPIAIQERWVVQLKGLAFPAIGVTVLTGTREHFRQTGKVLFTHFGLSGPLILNLASRIAAARQEYGAVVLRLDFFPNIPSRDLDQTLLERSAAQPGKFIKNAFGDWLPPRLIEKVIEISAVPPQTTLGQLSREQRQRVLENFKNFPLTFAGLMDESRAVVASGGIPIDEIDFRTMTSKLVPNLAIVGDLLDINRPSGGFSLQLCWATGWVAGTWAAGKSSDDHFD